MRDELLTKKIIPLYLFCRIKPDFDQSHYSELLIIDRYGKGIIIFKFILCFACTFTKIRNFCSKKRKWKRASFGCHNVNNLKSEKLYVIKKEKKYLYLQEKTFYRLLRPEETFLLFMRPVSSFFFKKQHSHWIEFETPVLNLISVNLIYLEEKSNKVRKFGLSTILS